MATRSGIPALTASLTAGASEVVQYLCGESGFLPRLVPCLAKVSDGLSVVVEHVWAKQGRRVSGDLRHNAPLPLPLHSFQQFAVLKLHSATGATEWASVIDGGTFATADEARDLAIDHRGDVYVTGDIGTDAFGEQDLASSNSLAGRGRAVAPHGAATEPRHAIALDSKNNVAVAGEFFQIPDGPNPGVLKIDGGAVLICRWTKYLST
jgi:hypothetical protein